MQELLNAIKEFVDNPENEEKSLDAFLQEVALLSSVDQDQDDDQDKVTMMTIHMAKGLEFPYVYVVGMEEDLFPSQMMLGSRQDLEEEAPVVLRSHHPGHEEANAIVCANALSLRAPEELRAEPLPGGYRSVLHHGEQGDGVAFYRWRHRPRAYLVEKHQTRSKPSGDDLQSEYL